MWETSTLGEVVGESGGILRTGPFGSQLHQSDYVADADGIPVVMPTNLSDGRIRVDRIARISLSDAERLGAHRLTAGDVVLPRRGDLSRYALVRSENAGWLCGTGCLRVNLAASETLLPTYLSYVLALPGSATWLNNHSVGATMANLNTKIVAKFPLRLPPIAEQRKIAGVLGAYDDLIEVNRRRIRVLEEMAQAIYREWFVEFRYPGHEQLSPGSVHAGTTPNDWRSCPIADVSDLVKRGVAPKYSDDSDQVVINQKCIRNGRLSLQQSRRHVKKVPTERLLITGDVLVNSTGVGTLGRVAQVERPLDNATVDTHVTIVRPSQEVTPEYFGMTLRSLQPEFEALGAGTTGQTELGRQAIGAVTLVCPPGILQRQFSEIVRPMRELMLNLEDQTVVLGLTRDLLLPRLVSGELDVSDLDIAFGEVVS